MYRYYLQYEQLMREERRERGTREEKREDIYPELIKNVDLKR